MLDPTQSKNYEKNTYLNDYVEEEFFMQALSNSFIKRRERKGSLPEIQPNHVYNQSNTNYSNLNNQTAQTQHLYENINLEEVVTDVQNNPFENQYVNSQYYSPNTTVQNESFIIDNNNNNTSITNANNNNNSSSQGQVMRRSRKNNAFVLEVARTSMFKSKSMTDLSSSLVRFTDNTNSFMPLNNDNHNSKNNTLNVSSGSNNNNNSTALVNKSLNNLNQLSSNSKVDFNDLYFMMNVPINTNYVGLIWQAADMCYNEYRDKYMELRWLMVKRKRFFIINNQFFCLKFFFSDW